MDECQPIRQFSLALTLFLDSVASTLSPGDTQKPLHIVSSVVPNFSLSRPGLVEPDGDSGGSGGAVSGVLAQEAYTVVVLRPSCSSARD